MSNLKHLIPKESVIASQLSLITKVERFEYDLYDLVQSTATGKIAKDKGIFPNSTRFILDTGFRDNQPRITLEIWQRNYNTTIPDASERIVPPFFYGDFVNQKCFGTNVPILNMGSDETLFFGNLIYAKDFTESFNSAKVLFGLVGESSSNEKWETIRPFRDADLSSLLNFIETVKKLMDGFLKGLEGIVAQILKYIHLLKTRIAQIQAIIARIKQIIDLILSFRFPAGLYGTFHLTNGTAGLVSALQQSEDKPDIGVNGYGSGVMVVAGGFVPSILVDLFIALMGGEGE
jgi:hypothetical protein